LSTDHDYYRTLAVARSATPEEIRARFRELAREQHPDRFRGEERARAELAFQEITAAFNVLIHPERRRQHDLELARPVATGTGGSDKARMVRFHLEAGVGFYRGGNYFAAAESFQRATEIDPRNHQAWHHLAQSLAHQRKFLPRATEAIARACSLHPMNLGYLKVAGRLFTAAGLFDRAEQYYNQALTWGGEDPDVTKALDELRVAAKKGKAPRAGRSA